MVGAHMVASIEKLKNCGIMKSIGRKMLVILLSLSLLPLLVVGFLSVEDASELGDSIISDSEETNIRTTTYLDGKLRERQESFYRNFTLEKADEYSNLFLQIEGRTETIANYASFVLGTEELKVDSINYSSVWLSPPYPNYNEIQGESWFFEEGDIHPYNESIRKGLVVLELIEQIVEEESAITQGYFSYQERITLLYPSATEVLLDIGHDLYPPVRPWYVKAETSDAPIWTAPYIEATEDTMTVTSAMAIRHDNGTVLGVVGLDIFLDDFRNDVLATELNLKGKAFVINENKEAIIASSSLSWLNYTEISETGTFPTVEERGDESFRSAIQDMASQEDGYLEVEVDNERYFLSFAPIAGLNMSLGILHPVKDVLDPVDVVNEKIDTDLRNSEVRAEEKVEEMRKKLLFVTLLFAAAVLVMACFLSKTITKPIIALKEGADLVGKGDLGHRVVVKTGDELEELAESFNTMASYLDVQMKLVEQTAREKERIERELQIAHEIQKSFLPIKAPEIPGYEMAGINLPAREVGGDFYDFIDLGDNKTGIVIADVSGKGVPAALFMGISKTLLRANVKRILDPVEALKEVNSILLDESDSGMFVTLFYAIIDSKDHSFTFINAGHNPPILQKKGDIQEFVLLEAKGIPVGVMEDMSLESKEIRLKENETVFLYTDGVTEAVNKKNEEFGTTRLQDILNRETDASADALIEAVVREIKQFAGALEQFDDITMVVLKVNNEER